MKVKDLLRVCLQNLSRHKARTMLTVLGVIVGCCSVVIMVSIGIGMKEAQEKALSQMGDLTIINIYPLGKGKKAAKLDDHAVRQFKEMPEVTAVTPRLTAENVPVRLYAGHNRRYKGAYASIVGIDLKVAGDMGYQLKEGTWDKPKRGSIYAGQSFAYGFEDTKRPEGRNMVDFYSMDVGADGVPVMPPAFFDPQKVPLVMEMESGKDDGKKNVQDLKVSGILKEDYGKGEETSMGMIMDLTELRSLLEQQARISGKTVQKKAGYTNVLVKVEGINDVARVEQAVRRMGFRTSSMENIRKPMEQEARQKQMMLGGLGAISLFVAALGITNTMIMSISERTREIGVMKSLGCFVRDIRRIFLLEAGCIGLLGGVTGTVLSYGISVVMNMAAGSSSSSVNMMDMPMDTSMRLSVIPWWLAVFAILFSIMVGVGAGYYPANKAVGISALEAIKHD